MRSGRAGRGSGRLAARRVRRRLALLAGAAIVAALLVALAWRADLTLPTASGSAAGAAEAPDGVRIRVEVLNATTTPRLARHATRYLRARGFDVVEIGNASEKLDSTLVLDRTGNPEWASRVAAAMDGARVEARPDSSRYLDVTVLVGASWRLPAESFHP